MSIRDIFRRRPQVETFVRSNGHITRYGWCLVNRKGRVLFRAQRTYSRRHDARRAAAEHLLQASPGQWRILIDGRPLLDFLR